jgi:hypothetical protein
MPIDRCYVIVTFCATIPYVSEQSVTSQPAVRQDFLASWFGGRLVVLGTASLGFIATFSVIRNEIASLKDALLALLVFVPAYLFLISLNMVWVARSISRLGLPTWRRPSNANARRVRMLVMAVIGLAFGIVAALWYVHTVAK